jgi:hypothetical protein
MNDYTLKFDKVYDADNLEQCYNIWRSKKLYLADLTIYEYNHDKKRKDVLIEQQCRYEGDQMMITISNHAWIGWTYYKPDLYIRGLVDGNGRMVEHRRGHKFWEDISTLSYS